MTFAQYTNFNESEKIKISLLEYIYNNHFEEKDIAVPEVTITGKIADILVANGLIHIYEIKSKSDSLKRLPEQIKIFKKYANKVTVVADTKFIPILLKEAYMNNVGIIEVDNEYRLKPINQAAKNNIPAPHYLIYFNTKEIRETLRGLTNKWYKMNFIDAENKIIEILKKNEIKQLCLFRIKEKFIKESSIRKNYIQNKHYEYAIFPRYKSLENGNITPLRDIMPHICNSLSSSI